MPLFLTHRNWASLGSRIAVAAVFIPHGLDKLQFNPTFGWRGLEYWTKTFSDAAPFLNKYLAPDQIELFAHGYALTQVVCGGLVLVGLLARPAVLPLLVMTLLGIFRGWSNGFWADATVGGVPAPGFELQMVLLAIGCGLLFSGAGSISVDKLIACEPEAEDIVCQWEDEDEEYYGEEFDSPPMPSRRMLH